MTFSQLAAASVGIDVMYDAIGVDRPPKHEPNGMKAVVWFFGVCADRYYARQHSLPVPLLPRPPTLDGYVIKLEALPRFELAFKRWADGR